MIADEDKRVGFGDRAFRTMVVRKDPAPVFLGCVWLALQVPGQFLPPIKACVLSFVRIILACQVVYNDVAFHVQKSLRVRYVTIIPELHNDVKGLAQQSYLMSSGSLLIRSLQRSAGCIATETRGGLAFGVGRRATRSAFRADVKLPPCTGLARPEPNVSRVLLGNVTFPWRVGASPPGPLGKRKAHAPKPSGVPAGADKRPE